MKFVMATLITFSAFSFYPEPIEATAPNCDWARRDAMREARQVCRSWGAREVGRDHRYSSCRMADGGDRTVTLRFDCRDF